MGALCLLHSQCRKQMCRAALLGNMSGAIHNSGAEAAAGHRKGTDQFRLKAMSLLLERHNHIDFLENRYLEIFKKET